MNHFGHIIVGLAAGAIAQLAIAALQITELQVPLFTFLAVASLGALLPDIDLKQSKISQLARVVFVAGGAVALQPFLSKFFSGITSWVAAVAACAVILFLILFPLRLKHRGATHTFKAAFIFAAAITLTSGIGAGIIALASYASHLLADKV